MKLTIYSAILCQTCCVYAAAAVTLHLHPNVNSKTGNITNEGIVNILSDNMIRLKQSSHGSEPGTEVINLFNTSIINQKTHTLKLLNESQVPVLLFLARLRAINSTHSRARVIPADAISVRRNPSLWHLPRRLHRRAPGNPSLWRTPRRRLHKQTSAIDNFRSAYTSFYQLLQPFLGQLTQRFKEGTSPTLQNVQVITEVMPLDDLDILTGNTVNIIDKFFVVQESLLAVLDNIRPFVVATYLEWFRSQSALLEWRMNIVGFGVLSLRLRDEAHDVSSMDSFCTKYTAFFGKLQEFVALLCQRYKTGVSSTLQDVPLICKVLQPDDLNSLAGGETNEYQLVKDFMTVIFDRGDLYVDDEHLEWFKKQSEELKQMMEELANSWPTFRCRRRSDDVQNLLSGAGGVNSGIKPHHNGVVEKLLKVVEELQ